ncbi:hypothetical protein Pint_08790 [Pistacia integerrima]|uniref:Uncharacterized protein n=1 Tax=Pistacia integerrima TaxID=434235 RepID=A0ACC0XUF3_9ROSI|nr:hypothetical protein Pint_08790 [Pistacia integerrima]
MLLDSGNRDVWLSPMLVLELFRYLLLTKLFSSKTQDGSLGCRMKVNHFIDISILEAANTARACKIKI